MKINHQTKQQNSTRLHIRGGTYNPNIWKTEFQHHRQMELKTPSGLVGPLMSSSFSGAISHTLNLSTPLGSSVPKCGLRVTCAIPATISALPGTCQKSVSTHLFKGYLAPLEVDGPEGRSCGPRCERLEWNKDWLPGTGGVVPQGLVVFSLGADLAPDSEGLLYGAKAWWAPKTVAVRWGAWGAGYAGRLVME